MTLGQEVCYTSLQSEPASSTELADSMVTLGEPGDGNFACGIHPAAQIAIGEQQWVTGFHCACEVW